VALHGMVRHPANLTLHQALADMLREQLRICARPYPCIGNITYVVHMDSCIPALASVQCQPQGREQSLGAQNVVLWCGAQWQHGAPLYEPPSSGSRLPVLQQVSSSNSASGCILS
jgi:hypothetical protein